tara:strand:- start:487 stop:750 length:264 start_codon:yes stop_codon:yes gene_type:complete
MSTWSRVRVTVRVTVRAWAKARLVLEFAMSRARLVFGFGMYTLRGVMLTEWGATLPSLVSCSARTALWSMERCDGPGVTRCDVSTDE